MAPCEAHPTTTTPYAVDIIIHTKTINMKYLFLFLSCLLLSCSNEKSNPKKIEADFTDKAKLFHELYITAGDCSARNAMIDKDIIFFENGKTFTYEGILEYCSYIKPKKSFDIYSKQYIIQPNVGFDYVEQYYVNSELDTLRETTSRIWQLKSNNWILTHMQVSRQLK